MSKLVVILVMVLSLAQEESGREKQKAGADAKTVENPAREQELRQEGERIDRGEERAEKTGQGVHRFERLLGHDVELIVHERGSHAY